MQPKVTQPNGQPVPKTISGTVARPFQIVEQEMAGNQIIGIKDKRVVQYGERVTLPYQLAREMQAAGKFVAGEHSREELAAAGYLPPIGTPAAPAKAEKKADA
jgi:hypothetical protein